MLFNFFKKHEQQSAVNEHLGGFQDDFNEHQKKAIMISLFLIANSDGEYHNKENQFFEQTATLLGYRLNPDFDKTVDDFMTMDKPSLFRHLNSLGSSQKDWYIVTAFGMVHADGQALEEEFQYMLVFFDEMGITEERFENVLKKTELMMKMFNG
ncbi:TerB family tellurite resistance protein [Mariniflexile sp. HNIBRBA6329]|uniref:TerB family tellurite resistance protein n=1 Tax=Mariniflexile sp. HNIBRBA6329 TaxID=3373088 RepID=UPI0037453E03